MRTPTWINPLCRALGVDPDGTYAGAARRAPPGIGAGAGGASVHFAPMLIAAITSRWASLLMPASEKRTWEAVNRAIESGPDAPDGPQTAQRG